MAAKKVVRADHVGPHRTPYQKNKKRIFSSLNVCALCGKPVDFSLKWPDPMSATIDHIIPVSKGGSPDAIENMQLAHLSCNRVKGDAIPKKRKEHHEAVISNRLLPQHCDWSGYR